MYKLVGSCSCCCGENTHTHTQCDIRNHDVVKYIGFLSDISVDQVCVNMKSDSAKHNIQVEMPCLLATKCLGQNF